MLRMNKGGKDRSNPEMKNQRPSRSPQGQRQDDGDQGGGEAAQASHAPHTETEGATGHGHGNKDKDGPAKNLPMEVRANIILFGMRLWT